MARFFTAFAAMVVLWAAPVAAEPIRVVTTTPTLAAIVRDVGGEHVEVVSIVDGGENAHTARPSAAAPARLRRAELLILTGLDAEPWLDDLLQRVPNERIERDAPGHLDASRSVDLIERSDASPAGGVLTFNPHFLLDPMNGVRVAHAVSESLAMIDPSLASTFDANAIDFEERVTALAQEMEARLAPLRGAPVLVFHETWTYFFQHFGIIEAARVETAPGASVKADRLREVVDQLRLRPPAFIIQDEYTKARDAARLSRALGAPVVELITEVGSEADVKTYEDLMRRQLQSLLDAHRRWRGGRDSVTPQPQIDPR